MTLVVFGLSTAVPAQNVQAGGHFPFGWFTRLLQVQWASAQPKILGLPQQQRGQRPQHGGYVPAAATASNGGAGRAPGKAKGSLKPYAPYDPSAKSTKVEGRPRGYVAATSKRDAAASAAAMDQYANADGSTTRVYKPGASNYKSGGSWQRIDPTLVGDGSGGWTMKASGLKVSLAGTAGKPVKKGFGEFAFADPDPSGTPTTAPSGTPTPATSSSPASSPSATPSDGSAQADPLASVTLPGGESVGYDLAGASAVTATVSGSTATYADILPGTDLQLQTITSGVKETLVLDAPPASSEWVFPLHLSGLSPRMTADGSVELVDDAGKVQAWFPRGSMTDAKFDPDSGDFTRSSAVTMSLTTAADGGPALKVVADSAWLDDPARVYPVKVDPTLTTLDTGSAYVDNDSGTTAGDQAGNNLALGTYDGGTTKARSYLNFGYFGSQVNGAKITAASLKLYLTYAKCGANLPFYVVPPTVAWSSTTLATTAYPGPAIAASSIGSLTVSNPTVACNNSGADRSVGLWVTVPLSVATFNDWTANGTNYGLALTSSVTDSNAWKRFTSERYNSGAYTPQLILTYTADVVPQVDTRYPANNATVETLTPQLVTRAHDPDAWPNQGLTYAYTVYNSAAAVVASSGTISSAGWQVPAGKLAWNQTYFYSVTVGDHLHTAAATSLYAFGTPVPQPRLTNNLAQNPGVGFDPNNGNYTTSATDASVAGVGPELEISRSYNSLDTRRTGAFGQGWSSILDTKATQKLDATGAVQTVAVTYPNGSEVAFGRNADGTFTAPSGRYATLTAQTSGSTVTGYTLTDKNATQYVFGRPVSGGVFQVTQIIDANGRTLAFAYDGSGLISTVTNASGRKLTLGWMTTASPTAGPHVASVTTDAPAAGGTGYTWNYSYADYDRLTGVCPPGTTTACTTYTWSNWINQYAHATLNLNPYSYWRLGEVAGTASAVSSVLTNAGVDNGTYQNVTLGGAAALPNSGATSAAFNGSSSFVQLPGKLVADGSYQSLSLWFKTSTPGGVLFSYSGAAITAGTTATNYVPALYVDANGYLRGEFWQGTAAPIKSSATVTNGAWHHVVLSGAGATQTMYLDGVAQGSLAGTIAMYNTSSSAYEYVGAGFVGGTWPDHANTGVSPAKATYFTGSISDVAFYNKALTSADVSTLNSVATNSSSVIQSVKSQAGRTQAQVAVSNVTGDVTTVTDENGGTWTMGQPSIAGNSDVYAASVLSAKPVDYWRLGETSTDVTDAVNEVAGDTASYSSVTLGTAGPFADNTAAQFDGSTSNVSLPGTVAPGGASSASVWFNTTATGKVIYDVQAGALGDTTAPGLPALWISADGKLRGLAPSTTPTGPLRLGIAGKCLDDSYSGTADRNKVDIWTCNNGKAQTWQMYGDGSVRVFGKCLDVTSSGTANGTLIQLYTCNGGVAQVWQPYNGGLRNPNSGKCLDDPGSSTTDGTQLQLYTCNGTSAQNWTMSLASTAAVNDGNWHQAVLTTSGVNQTLYVDNVAVSSAAGTVNLTPGGQPHAYLGAGFTGTGWSGLGANTTNYYSGNLAEAAFYNTELTAAQVDQQWQASKQTVPVAVTTVDNTIKTITMPVKTVTVTDPGNHTLSYSYDLINNRQISETDALGNTTRYGYDVGGFSSLVYNPLGVWTQTNQDARGNTIARITCQDQKANKCSTTYYEYYLNSSNPVDPRNDVLTASRDPRSANSTDNTYKTSYGLDAKGNPLTATDPLGRVRSASYTDGTTITAADSGFAPPGLPYQVVSPAGGRQQISYYANGDVAKTISPAGEVTAFTYDKLGRKLTQTVTTSTFPDGRTTTYTYDGLGRVVTETDPAVTNRVTGAVHTAVTTNAYDQDGNLTSQTVADATGGDVTRSQTVAYNSYGQKQSQTDPLGNTTGFAYNVYGQMVTQTDPDGGVTGFEVDPDGHLLTQTRKAWTGDPNNPSGPVDLVTETRTYDPDGRLASSTDALGWVTAYKYTDDGLTAQVIRTDKPLNSDGTPAAGATTFVQETDSYDFAGNLTTQVTNNGATTTNFTYDAASQQTTTTLDPSGLNRVTTDVYSPDDKVVSTTQRVGTGGALSVTDHQYDPEGRPRAEIAYNGDPATTPVGRWKLGETSGTTAADSSGNSTATTANVTWSTSAPAGHSGSASFTGTDDSRIAADGPVLDTGRPYTVSAWVYLTSNSENRAAVSQDGAVQSAFMLGSSGSPTNKWRLFVTQGGANSQVVVNSTVAAQTNTWTHLVGVYDGSKATLYVNGVNQGSVSATSANTNGPLLIGDGQWNGNRSDAWPGNIADVQVYQRAMTDAQAAAVYSGAAPAAGDSVTRTSSKLDEGGLATRTTDPRGNTTDVSYDEAERPTVNTSAAVTAETATGAVVARPVSYTGYDTFGDRTETVDSNGNQTTDVYDRDGRVYERHVPAYTAPDGSTINPVSSVVYDSLGQTRSRTDALGNTTSYTYDQLGRVAKTVAPNDGTTTTAYDLDGDPTAVTGPTGATVTATYDFLGRRATSTQVVRQTSEADTTGYAYDSAGRLQQTTSPAGVTNSYTYDAAGETLTSVDGAGQTATTAYDGLGRATRVTAPDGTYRTTTYDMLSRVTGTAAYAAAGGTALTSGSQTYDRAGNVLTSTDGRGTANSYTYDPTGLLLSERQPTSATSSVLTSFGYDLNGNRTRYTDGRGNPWFTTYNSWNLKQTQIEPATTQYSSAADSTTTYTYDAGANLTRIGLPGGVAQTFDYNAMGNLLTQQGAGASAETATRSFSYDQAGRLLTAGTSNTAATGSNATDETFTYDDRGNLLTASGSAGSTTLQYNSDGLPTSRADASGTTAYTYDGADRVKTIHDALTGTILSYSYNTLSQVSSVNEGSGDIRKFGYDDLHRLTSDQLQTPGGAVVSSIGYGYDANSNLTSKNTTGFGGSVSNTYTYDLADRLTSWNNGTNTVNYGYDATGNRTQVGAKTFTYDARDQLTSDGSAGYTYTAAGVLSAQGATTLTCDAYGQQTAYGAVHYTYDASGRMVARGNTTSSTAMQYSGTGNLLAADGDFLYSHDPAGGLLGVQAATGSASTARLALTDQHTDVVATYTPADTTLTQTATYDPLGNVLGARSTIGNLGYQSEYTDGGTGKVNMAARWYNPATGQFTSKDTVQNNPVPNSVAANPFAYGNDDPFAGTDPTGHMYNEALGITPGKRTTPTPSRRATTKPHRQPVHHIGRPEDRLDHGDPDGYVAYHNTTKKQLANLRAANKAIEKSYRSQRPGHQMGRPEDRLDGGDPDGYVAYHNTTKTQIQQLRDANNAIEKSIRDRASSKGALVIATNEDGTEHVCINGFFCLDDHSVVNPSEYAALYEASLERQRAQYGITSFRDDEYLRAMVEACDPQDLGKSGKPHWVSYCTSWAANWLDQLYAPAAIKARTEATGSRGSTMPSVAGGIGLTVAAVLTNSCDLEGVSGGLGRGDRESFSVNTPVLTANGAVKPIGKLKPGDRVETTDPVTGARSGRPVTATTVHRDHDLADLILADPKGRHHTVHTTESHPFWDVSRQQWVTASHLATGDRLASIGGGDPTVVAVVPLIGENPMYNLTVADVHTYFVVAGSVPVLVHNCGGTETAPNGKPHSTKCTCADGGTPRIVRNTGGMRGDTATRTQDIGLQFDLMDENPDWIHVAGGTRPQIGIRSPSGQLKFPDLTFENEMGEPVYYQTADVNPDGTFTDRELENAEFLQQWGGGQVILVPKL